VLPFLRIRKFHLLLFVPVALLAKCEWRVSVGLAAGAAGLLAVSFYAEGPLWPSFYLRMMLDPNASPRVQLMPNFRALASALRMPFLEFLLPIPVLVVVIGVARASNFAVSLASALLAGIISTHHA
jgi:hypothetical protein